MAQQENGSGTPGAQVTAEALFEAATRAHRDGDMAGAAGALDRVLALAPRARPALTLRARIAFERGEADALARFDAAIRADPGNAELHLGKARALEQAGDARGARIVARQIAAQAPGYIPALAFLASLHLAQGEEDFTAPFAAAARQAPQDPNIPAAHIDALAGIGRFAEATQVAAEARQRFAHEPHFAMLEAIHAGSAGDWARAEAIYRDLPAPRDPAQALQIWLAEARHRLRAAEIAAAGALIERALAAAPRDVAAWALQGIVWRLSDAPQDKARARWLHEQAGLVQMRALEAPADLLAHAAAHLRQLHAHAGMPLSQSLRGGSQTRGILFHRTQAEFAQLHAAIMQTLEVYRADLPARDPTHPLLAQRDAPWRLAGSWSVRLIGGGDHHAAHIHPAGIVSSALYIALPDEVAQSQRHGWLELGRPPADLGHDLEPLATLQPRAGHLALFPSTLYHGTTPFGPAGSTQEAGERLTVAFDVITKSQ